MARPGPRTVRKYSDDFKLAAVRLSQQPGIQVRTVAAALAIHPFMLSKWRKEVRDGVLRRPRHASPPVGGEPLAQHLLRRQLEVVGVAHVGVR
jgi:transposase-like protein